MNLATFVYSATLFVGALAFVLTVNFLVNRKD